VAHDFKKHPELKNGQLEFYYFESPHIQITQDFKARVTKVIDGDTVKVQVDFRDFEFPIRFANTAAPELSEEGGEASRSWLENELMNEEIFVKLAKARVGKFGRILGEIIHMGRNMNNLSLDLQYSIPFSEKKRAAIPSFGKQLKNMEKQWA